VRKGRKEGRKEANGKPEKEKNANEKRRIEGEKREKRDQEGLSSFFLTSVWNFLKLSKLHFR
jgi:hypothetical protein